MTPRQWIAVICLASVVGSSSLRLFCESVCSSHHATSAALHCHESAESGATLTPADDCGQHDSLPALAEGRRITTTPELTAVSVTAYVVTSLPHVTVAAIRAIVDTSPPPTARPLSLRI